MGPVTANVKLPYDSLSCDPQSKGSNGVHSVWLIIIHGLMNWADSHAAAVVFETLCYPNPVLFSGGSGGFTDTPSPLDHHYTTDSQKTRHTQPIPSTLSRYHTISMGRRVSSAHSSCTKRFLRAPVRSRCVGWADLRKRQKQMVGCQPE